MTELNTIACVEDDEDIRSIIKLTLSDIKGWDVTLFSDGSKALDGIEAASPQVIVLDVMMPGMDGLETLAKIRTISGFEDKPAIFMTAKAQPTEMTRYKDAGAVGVIVKPFDPMTLAEQIQNLWANAA